MQVQVGHKEKGVNEAREGAADILSSGRGPLHSDSAPIITDQSGLAWHGTVSIEILSLAWETHRATVLVKANLISVRKMLTLPVQLSSNYRE